MGREYPNTIMSGSPMLATDVSSLHGVRTFIQQDLDAAGQSYGWTWNNVVSGDAILAKHLYEMRAAIQVLWDFKARGPLPMWSSGVWPGGPSLGTAATPFFASDLTDLRTWLNQYEDNHPPSDQGVDSLCFDPNDANRPTITDAWAQDILDLATEKPLFVRANVKARSDNSIPEEDRVQYRLAFNRYRNKGLRVFGLFTREFDRVGDPTAPLEEDFANPYIRHFSDRAAEISADLKLNAGVDDYIIWNEPNDIGAPANQLDEQHFAALLYHCWQKMTAVARVYWGGVIFGFGAEQNGSWVPDQNALNYLDGVYQALYNGSLAGGEYGGWPWTGINVHIHRDRDDRDAAAIFDGINERKTKWGDAGDTVVGEWGVTDKEERESPGKLSHIFNLLKPRASIMFLHSHHQVQENPEEYWGLHEYSVVGQEYVLGAATNLHGPYDELVGP